MSGNDSSFPEFVAVTFFLRLNSPLKYSFSQSPENKTNFLNIKSFIIYSHSHCYLLARALYKIDIATLNNFPL